MVALAAPMPLAGPAPASTRAELWALLRLSGPLVGANLLQMGVYAVDVMFVARLGAIDFAAATLGVFLFSLIMPIQSGQQRHLAWLGGKSAIQGDPLRARLEPFGQPLQPTSQHHRAFQGDHVVTHRSSSADSE